MGKLEITIMPDGEVRCLAPEDLDLRVLGPLDVQRASHVEFDNEAQWWTVTWANGQEAAAVFDTRQDALDYERGYLNLLIDGNRIEEVLP